jgi:hypothetical protein
MSILPFKSGGMARLQHLYTSMLRMTEELLYLLCLRDDGDVQVGDKVLLPEYGGAPVKVDNEEMVLYKEFEILGKFE